MSYNYSRDGVGNPAKMLRPHWKYCYNLTAWFFRNKYDLSSQSGKRRYAKELWKKLTANSAKFEKRAHNKVARMYSKRIAKIELDEFYKEKEEQ